MLAGKRKRAITIALVAFALFLVLRPYTYTYLIWPLFALSQSWEGTVVERYERRYGPYGPRTYHWRVECTDGRTRTCDIPDLLYTAINSGATVRKEKGKRWPQVVGPANGATLLQEQMGDRFPERVRPLVPTEP